MKTNLPLAIATVEEAKSFLTALYINGESYHPEDDAHDVIWTDITGASIPDFGELNRLNILMGDIYNLPGNDGRHSGEMAFDPCEFLLCLDPAYLKRLTDDNEQDDRIFTSADMFAFAVQMSRYAISHKHLTATDFEKYVSTELSYQEGDGSYQDYVMPTR